MDPAAWLVSRGCKGSRIRTANPAATLPVAWTRSAPSFCASVSQRVGLDLEARAPECAAADPAVLEDPAAALREWDRAAASEAVAVEA